MKRTFFALFVFGVFAIAPGVHADTLPSAASIIAYVNSARVSNGLAPFQENLLLDSAAVGKARALAATGVLVHTTAPTGVAWSTLANVGYVYTSAGENLAANIEDAGTLVNDWMNSPEHRANLLNINYVDVGVGVAQGVYQGQVSDFVVLYAAHPKPAPLLTLHTVIQTMGPQANIEQIAKIRTMLSLLTNYLLALTAQQAEASINPYHE